MGLEETTAANMKIEGVVENGSKVGDSSNGNDDNRKMFLGHLRPIPKASRDNISCKGIFTLMMCFANLAMPTCGAEAPHLLYGPLP
jgi:hypothetical protein